MAIEDVMLAQKIWLENDEKAVLKKANVRETRHIPEVSGTMQRRIGAAFTG